VGHCVYVDPGKGFFCMPQPLNPGTNGVQCHYPQDCSPGFTCVGCEGVNCCREFCDVNEGCEGGVECYSFENFNVDPVCFGDIGYCKE
jgi:hypothetical protein